MYREHIHHILGEASKVARLNFGKVSGSSKGTDNNQVLTDTDLEISKLIVGWLHNQYPDHNIIDEEAGVIDKSSKYTWVVDPIDGTSNFANGVPLYGILLGLLRDGVPIAGGLALPSFHEIYTAERGAGAYCNGTQIKVTQETQLLSCLVAYGIDGHQEDPSATFTEMNLLGNIVLGVRNLRTSNSAYDFAMVAKGGYGANLNRSSKIWDNVAPQILLEEAGALYTDFYGNPIDYSDPLTKVDTNYTLCTAAPLLHEQLQAIIQGNASVGRRSRSSHRAI
jgi:myo-inositol-1(or 4)-monophosphatase